MINLEGSKQLMSSLFEMEIHKITETIRRESGDDKDKLILEHEATITKLREENSKMKKTIESVKLVVIG